MTKFVWKSKFKRIARADTCCGHKESFARSESGLMTIMTLAMVLVVFAVAGFAVDIMRFDRERARLQYALDRAVLAAADLEQDLCPRVVIKDYLKKEGLEQYLEGEPIVTPDICGSQAITIEGYRRVEATAKMDVAMHFMQWWDVDTITTSVASVAEEAIGNVEISLVLDVSGSMNSNSRLPTLKVAAQNFVQEMVDKTEDGKLSISLIPYATQVSLPDYLMDELSTTGTNTHANCINFTSSEFSTTVFDPSLVRQRTLHFTPWGDYDRRPSNQYVYSEVCESDTNREVMVHQKDATVLKDRIGTFTAGGNTSIDLGVKWGLTLLDPTFRPVNAALAAKSDIPAEFASRPSNYTNADTMKVLVLMTDGANTTQYMVRDPYRTADADIWWNDDEEIYSYYVPEATNFIWPDIPIEEYDYSRGFYWIRESRQPHAYGNGQYTQYRCRSYSSNNGYCYDVDYSTNRVKNENGGSVSLTWRQVLEQTTRYEVYQMLNAARGYNFARDWYYDVVATNGSSQKDPRTRALCAQAKAKNIFVFAIALEAPQAGRDILWDCKTDENTYYNATPGNLPDVFASIGSSIRNLRLTQ